MASQTLILSLVGNAPLVMHNGQLADPLCKAAKDVGAISSKRKKTDADHEEMARLEFLGSLYMGKDGPIVPADNIEAAIIEGAKKLRKGTEAKCGVFVNKHASLIYDGPRDPKGLWEDERFRFRKGVRIQKVRIMRMRPIFHEWRIEAEVSFNDEVLNKSDILAFIKKAGMLVGLGDWRPRYGRFDLDDQR